MKISSFIGELERLKNLVGDLEVVTIDSTTKDFKTGAAHLIIACDETNNPTSVLIADTEYMLAFSE